MATVDYSGEWQYIEGVEDVMLLMKNPQKAPVAEVKALRGDPSRKEVSAASSYGWPAVDMVFVLWVETMSGYEPTHGDKVKDAENVTWTILSASKEKFGAQYRVLVKRDV